MDASDHSRLSEAKEALNGVTEHDKMRGKPILIFANKQDCEGAVNEDQLGMLLAPVDPQDELGKLSRVVYLCFHLMCQLGHTTVCVLCREVIIGNC